MRVNDNRIQNHYPTKAANELYFPPSLRVPESLLTGLLGVLHIALNRNIPSRLYRPPEQTDSIPWILPLEPHPHPPRQRNPRIHRSQRNLRRCVSCNPSFCYYGGPVEGNAGADGGREIYPSEVWVQAQDGSAGAAVVQLQMVVLMEWM